MNKPSGFPLVFLVLIFLLVTCVGNGSMHVAHFDEKSTLKSAGAFAGASFSEGMGYPANQFTTEYYFPWYDNKDMLTWILVSNPSATLNAYVDIYIGGVQMNVDPLEIPASGYIRAQYDWIQNGPVHVVSTNGQPILASERTIYHSFTLPGATYYVSSDGDDANPGTQTSPWQTIQKAVTTAEAGDMIFVRGGEYETIFGGWSFQNSGTQTKPISLVNYPGEQVVIKISQLSGNFPAFRCWIAPNDPTGWQTTYANYIRILGTDVSAHTLSGGVVSQKGIVIQGMMGEQIYAINGAGCDNWEVAGVDFIETAAGIRTFRRSDSPDHWYVHNNRVYNYYRESGMQFNGNNNMIVNNEIYKVSNNLDTPYGCQLLNLLGHGNIVRGNILSRLGSTAICGGILFEWDLADKNTIEHNLIFDVPVGIFFQGGDNNIIRNNIIYQAGAPDPHRAGIEIHSYDNQTTWPCNDVTVNDPANPDYPYYYNPRNCHSFGNQIYNNTIHGFTVAIDFSPLVGENTIIRNNVFSGWTRASICYYIGGTCFPLPTQVTADYNAEQSPFGFVDIDHFDFHLMANSPLIDSGYELGSLNPDDFDGNTRPQGQGFDIGAYEFLEP